MYRRLLLAVVVTGCANAAPVQLVVPSEPYVINGPAPVPVPAQLLRRNGELIAATGLDVQLSADSAVQLTNGRLSCDGAGEAEVTLSSGALRARFSVRCRPITSFRPPPALDLYVGGPPQPLAIQALGPENQPVTEWRAGILVHDTSVVRVARGYVYPLRRGRTSIRLDFGGIYTPVPAMVVERVIADSVFLAQGEYRAWQLPAGRYEIRLTPFTGVLPARPFWLRSLRANCAPDTFGVQTYHCLVDSSATIVVRRPASPERTPDVPLSVLVLRRPT